MTFTTGVSAFLYLMFMRSKRMLQMNLKEKLIGTIELGGTFMSVALIKKTFHSNVTFFNSGKTPITKNYRKNQSEHNFSSRNSIKSKGFPKKS
jgi:hypothetical protein